MLRFFFVALSNFPFYLLDSVNGDVINQAESCNVGEYLSKLNHKYVFKNWSLTSAYGLGIRYDVTTDNKLTHVVKRQFLNNIKLGDISEVNAYSYVEQQAGIGKWLIDAGMRMDYLYFQYWDKLSVQQLPAQSLVLKFPFKYFITKL